jgi:hypothetical protein
MVAGRHVGGAALVVGLFLPGLPTYAQEPATNVPTTRAEAIAEARDEKVAELWPERQSPLVNKVNALVERGFKEGLDSGRGANGPQIGLPVEPQSARAVQRPSDVSQLGYPRR